MISNGIKDLAVRALYLFRIRIAKCTCLKLSHYAALKLNKHSELYLRKGTNIQACSVCIPEYFYRGSCLGCLNGTYASVSMLLACLILSLLPINVK